MNTVMKNGGNKENQYWIFKLKGTYGKFHLKQSLTHTTVCGLARSQVERTGILLNVGGKSITELRNSTLAISAKKKLCKKCLAYAV